jgi:uncharacterized protein YjbI with pentapeptide repeats
MTALRKITSRPGTVAAVALGLALLIAVVLCIFWFGRDWWKFLIGWKALVNYIDPQRATDKKDAVQVYAVIVAGVVAAITASVGLLNLRLTRRNLEQQRELEATRAKEQRDLARGQAQGTALQAYYEQIGKLITDKGLLDTQRKEIRVLARGQTLTVLQAVDGNGKGSLLTFLHGAALIRAKNPVVVLTTADLREAELPKANLRESNLQLADLSEANLREVNFEDADLLRAKLPNAYLEGAILLGTNLREAHLEGAILQKADLRSACLQEAHLEGAFLQDVLSHNANPREAYLQRAHLQGADLEGADLEGAHLRGATMPNGQKYEDWLKSRESGG